MLILLACYGKKIMDERSVSNIEAIFNANPIDMFSGAFSQRTYVGFDIPSNFAISSCVIPFALRHSTSLNLILSVPPFMLTLLAPHVNNIRK